MESLNKVTLSLKLPPRIKENLEIFLWVKSVWHQVFSAKENKIRPINVDNGVLYIGVSDHYELQNMQANYLKILEKFKGLFPENSKFPLRAIKFIYRPTKEEKFKLKMRSKIDRTSFRKEDLKALMDYCKQLSDPELGALFQRLLKNYYNLIT